MIGSPSRSSAISCPNRSFSAWSELYRLKGDVLVSAASPVVAATASEEKEQHDDQDDEPGSAHGRLLTVKSAVIHRSDVTLLAGLRSVDTVKPYRCGAMALLGWRRSHIGVFARFAIPPVSSRTGARRPP